VSEAGPAWPPRGGEVAVDLLDQAEASGQIVQGDDGAELGDDRVLGRGGPWGRGLGQGGDDVVSAAEILLPDDLGLAVDAAAFAWVVVGLAVDGLLEEARHAVGHTVEAACPSRGLKEKDLQQSVRSKNLGHTNGARQAERRLPEAFIQPGDKRQQVNFCRLKTQ